MSRPVNIRLADSVYERLVSSKEKMGITTSAYITYALKQVFQAEDITANLPDLLKISEQLNKIENKIDGKE